MIERCRRRRGETGFSLIEIMVSLMLFAILGSTVLGALIGADKAVDSAKSSNDVNEEARLAINRLSRELRQARSITSVIGTGGVNGLTFEADFNADGVIMPGAPDHERVTYEYLPASERVTISEVDSGGVVTTSDVLAGHVSAFSLEYYSSKYAYDCAPADGRTTWQELDGSTSPVCTTTSSGVGNGDGLLNAAELGSIDSVQVSFTVFEGARRQVYRTQIDLRNRA